MSFAMHGRWMAAVVGMGLAAVAAADLPGDGNGNKEIDFGDFLLMQQCGEGPGYPVFPGCEDVYDYDFDHDIDMTDLASFQRCFGGANPDCAPHVARIENGCLHIIGTSRSSTLSLQLRPGQPDVLQVLIDQQPVPTFEFDRSLFDCIVIDARGGDDVIYINEEWGIFTDTELTTINGGAGDDAIFGGSGPEIFVPGDGVDYVEMGPGDDRFIWSPGDDADYVDGNDGVDTVEVNGGSLGEQFTVTANGTRVRFDRLTPSPFNLDIGSVEKLDLHCHGGDDRVACTGNLASLIQIRVDGGPGDDTLLGSNGADVLIGGEGNDFLDGQQGADQLFGGPGDDVFQWDPGDGNELVEGGPGEDTLRFNGSNTAEIFELSADGTRLRLTRNVANVVMDVNEVERVELSAHGGADSVDIRNLTGTHVTEVEVELATFTGDGDAAMDVVSVFGSDGDDRLFVAGGGGASVVTGGAAAVRVSGAEPSVDQLVLYGLAGRDELNATALPANVINLTLNGGSGDDVLLGSQGPDLLRGDDDNDTLDGQGGADFLLGGAGHDRLIWNPGGDSDLMEGQDGDDVIEINGSDESEIFTITANGARVRFDRLEPAPFNLDIGTAEALRLFANDGADTLTCTGNLAALIQITADGGPGSDSLHGSNGADFLFGGPGADFIDGNQGDDVIVLGPGEDVVRWDPGDGSDTIEGGEGHDLLAFNGAAGAETFELSANGNRARFTRNLGNISLDMNGIEEISLAALAGTDFVIVNSMAGTDVTHVTIDLAGTIGGATGDSVADAVIVNGTPGPDAFSAISGAGAVQLSGIQPTIVILRAQVSTDSLTVNGLGGVDTYAEQPGVSTLITTNFVQ
jgi:Ca2+-binding RTX toxin-like protein